jgi:hypothetical protein
MEHFELELPERTLEPWPFEDEGEDDDDEYKVDSDAEADDSDSDEPEEHEHALPPDEGEEIHWSFRRVCRS